MKKKKSILSYHLLIAASVIDVICMFTLLLILMVKSSYPGHSMEILKFLAALSLVGQLIILPQIYSLTRRMKKVEDLCIHFAKGEIYNEFIDQIEEMEPNLGQAVKRLDSLLNRQETLKYSTQQAEFLALQNQINPHFLYNTLEAIRGDALSIGADSIADITEALSTFFRYTITNTKNLVTLQEELNNVETYFHIQKYPFGDNLSLMIRFKDDQEFLTGVLCPKLTLQPIIENSIFHGLEKNKDKGKIDIDIGIVDDTLLIEINDNGKGMSEAQLLSLNTQLARASIGYIVDDETSKKQGGIALKNVNRRIMLLFGEEYGLRVHSIPDVGTKVDVILPLERNEDFAQ